MGNKKVLWKFSTSRSLNHNAIQEAQNPSASPSITGPSSSGRTLDSDSSCRGSNPWGPANYVSSARPAVYWPIYEKLFCHDGMRVPVLFCGEGSIGTTCESRKKWLSVHKIPFRVLSSQRRYWIAWLVAIRWGRIITHKARLTSYKKAPKWFKAATCNGQIFVFWSSGYDPKKSHSCHISKWQQTNSKRTVGSNKPTGDRPIANIRSYSLCVVYMFKKCEKILEYQGNSYF